MSLTAHCKYFARKGLKTQKQYYVTCSQCLKYSSNLITRGYRFVNDISYFIKDQDKGRRERHDTVLLCLLYSDHIDILVNLVHKDIAGMSGESDVIVVHTDHRLISSADTHRLVAVVRCLVAPLG